MAKVTVTILLNFFKTFDSWNHNLKLAILNFSGLGENALGWVANLFGLMYLIYTFVLVYIMSSKDMILNLSYTYHSRSKNLPVDKD